MPRIKKTVLSPELLELILNTIFQTNQIGKIGHFDLETLQEIHAVDNYLKAGLGDQLREHIYVNYCRALRKENELGLDEQKLLIILRCVLKAFGYRIVSKYYKADFVNKVKYQISSNDEGSI